MCVFVSVRKGQRQHQRQQARVVGLAKRHSLQHKMIKGELPE
jgi:hypothetical protein